MSAGFQWAGSLSGAAPVVRKMQIGADCYVGQLAGLDLNNYGHVIGAAQASEAHENDQPIAGIITGVVHSPTYSSTYYGDKATYDAASAAQQVNDPVGATEVLVTLIMPFDTLIRGPIYDGTYGTALTELTAAADADGDDVVHASQTITAPTSGLSTVYCRSGANRGQYRLINSGGTNDQDVSICFSKPILAGDIFVAANVRLGLGGMNNGGTSNFIDGTTATHYYDVIYHYIDLEISGKEYAIFSFTNKACEYAGN